MLADTFLKRRLSSWNLSLYDQEKCHTLVLVKNDSIKSENLIKYAIKNGKQEDFITILCIVKLPVSTDLLLGRVLEPMGDEDMVFSSTKIKALTEIQKIVYSIPHSLKIDVKIMSGDPKTVISSNFIYFY